MPDVTTQYCSLLQRGTGLWPVNKAGTAMPHFSASAELIFPDDQLLKKRTGSSGFRVCPVVIRILII